MRRDQQYRGAHDAGSRLAGPGLNVIVLFLLIGLFAFPVFSQTAEKVSCDLGVQAPAFGFWTWSPNTRIDVYILAANFTTEEVPSLLKPVVRWDGEWQSTGSGVRLHYAGTTSAPRECRNCLTIMRAPVFNQKTRHGSELKAYSAEGTQLVTYAAILLDPALRDSQALTNAVAHELGHSFGLLDCYNCKDRSTVMNKLKRMNQSNGMEGPTPCDIAQVKRAYNQLSIRVSPAPIGMKAAVDEGEEPVEDDTPIVPG